MLLYLILAGALVLFLTVLERPASWRGRLFNLQAWGVNLAARVTLLPLVQFAVPVSLVSDAPWWIAAPLFVIAMDLGEYLFHRAQHAVPLLWRMHSLHHSDGDMNATTTERHFWGEQLIKAVTIWPLAALLVKPTPLILILYLAIAMWHFVSHSAVRLDFGKWSWLLNSPAYHRRHHSTRPEHFNSNFAALFPLFDVIAGSYHRPDSFPPTGLDHQPRHLADLALWPAKVAWNDRNQPEEFLVR